MLAKSEDSENTLFWKFASEKTGFVLPIKPAAAYFIPAFLYTSIKVKSNRGKRINFIFPFVKQNDIRETLLHLVDILGEKLTYYLYLCK